MSSLPGPPLDKYAVLVPIEVSDIPFILGYVLNFGFLGVLNIQVFIYAIRFRRDRRRLRFTVFLVFFLEVFNSVLVLYSAIFGANIRCLSCLVTGQRNYIRYGVSMSESLSTWAFQGLCVLTGLSSSIVQAYFAWRIWILSQSAWVPVVVIVVSSAQCVLLATGGILSSTDPNLGVFDTDGAVIWLIISAMCDVIITVRTTQLLFQSRDESNCRATKSLVRKLVKMTIETGLVTVIATSLEFAIAQTMNIAHHGVFYFLSKLYANCLLATLNARLAMRDQGTHGVITSVMFEPSDTQRSSSDSLGHVSYGVALELHKTLSASAQGQGLTPIPIPIPTPPPSSTRSITYRSVGVQNETDMVMEVDMSTTRAEVVRSEGGI